MKQVIVAGAAVIVFCAQIAAPPVIAVRAARLIDGRGGQPIAPAVVVIRGDRIEAAGSGVTIPSGPRRCCRASSISTRI